MKGWKVQSALTGLLLALVAIFGVVMHQKIVATAPSAAAIEAKDDLLAYACGKLAGGGLVLIWLLPFVLKKFRRP